MQVFCRCGCETVPPSRTAYPDQENTAVPLPREIQVGLRVPRGIGHVRSTAYWWARLGLHVWYSIRGNVANAYGIGPIWASCMSWEVCSSVNRVHLA
eukprot:881163-Pyramimonas_sp.AAC.1